MKGPVRRFWRRKLTETSSGEEATTGDTARFWQGNADTSWDKAINSPELWKKLLDADFISDEEIWALRYRLRRELIEFTRRRLAIQGQRNAQGDFIAFDQLLNPDALTIGFARRFATYKRAPLIFQQFENIVKPRPRPQSPHPVHLCRQGPSPR